MSSWHCPKKFPFQLQILLKDVPSLISGSFLGLEGKFLGTGEFYYLRKLILEFLRSHLKHYSRHWSFTISLSLATSHYLKVRKPNTKFPDLWRDMALKLGEIWPMKYKQKYLMRLLGKSLIFWFNTESEKTSTAISPLTPFLNWVQMWRLEQQQPSCNPEGKYNKITKASF